MSRLVTKSFLTGAAVAAAFFFVLPTVGASQSRPTATDAPTVLVGSSPAYDIAADLGRIPRTVRSAATTAPTVRAGPPTTVATRRYVHSTPVSYARTPVRSSYASSGSVWACIGRYESGNNPADNTGNGYYGEWQFAASTWLTMMRQMGLGYRSYPYAAAAPESVQLAAAVRLQREAGWGQWPVTSRRCGV